MVLRFEKNEAHILPEIGQKVVSGGRVGGGQCRAAGQILRLAMQGRIRVVG